MITMCVDGKGTVSSMKLKLEGESFEKRYQKIIIQLRQITTLT